MDDFKLIKDFLESKDDKIFNLIYKKHETLIYQRCYRYLKNEDDVEDVFQNIWVIIYFHLKDFNFKSEFSTWIIRISINQCINFLKSKKEFYSLDDPEFSNEKEVDSSVENQLETLINSENVTEILSALNAEELSLIKMKYLDEMSYKKIAQLTGLTNSALRMRISRIISKLREKGI